jgi:disulfide bond formation protein DsbB
MFRIDEESPRMSARRVLNAGGFLACLAMLGYALYAEKVLHLEPCPLCMFQRVGVAALGIVFLLAALHDPASRARARAQAVPSCGATLDYMLEVFPLFEVVRKVLTGGGECARIDWSFLGLSMPAWVLVAVLALAAFGLFVNLRGTAPSSVPKISLPGR